MKLIPEKYADHVCIRSTADRNCFFNSTLLIVYGHEENHIQLRLTVIIELIANADYYLQQKIFEQNVLYRDENMEKNNYINLTVDEVKSNNNNNNIIENYDKRPWQISNYYLVKLLKGQSEFPPQISISVLKTSETNKNLIKYC
ncbi:hypothetical protein C1646_776035 [Rhizophagus diaphanus]|nr:hypothetical protein C1646_776035 [Rhizophagus diaphanus] [Rhizophagus sp. MUCL 43196]